MTDKLTIIACLHTAESNIAVFEAAARRMGLAAGTLRHSVRADLLAAAERAGGMTADIAAETRAVLTMLARDADGVILTCSTLGPAAQGMPSGAGSPTLRADGALADEAVAAGGSVVVLCAVGTTLAPTTALFEAAARRTEARIDVRLVPGAWDLFRTGDRAGYLTLIAAASDAAYANGASVVALAQASMTDAVDYVAGPKLPLAPPAAGLRAMVARLAER